MKTNKKYVKFKQKTEGIKCTARGSTYLEGKALVGCDGLPKLSPLVRIRTRALQGRACRAQTTRPNAQPPPVQALHRYLKAFTLGTNAIAHGHLQKVRTAMK